MGRQHTFVDNPTCPLCDTTPLPPGRTVCHPCTRPLHGLLTNLGDTMTDLDDAIANAYTFTNQPHVRRTSTHPLPINLTAASNAWAVRQTIITWTDHATRSHGDPVPQTWTHIGTWLQHHTGWIAGQPWGPQAIDELTAALRLAKHTTDRPPDRTYLGTCNTNNCTQPLYAPEHTPDFTCPKCGTTHNTHERKQQLLNRIRDHHVTATQAVNILTALGLKTSDRTIRWWRKEGHITTPASNPKGQPLYRVGDIIDRLNTPTTPPTLT